LSHQTDDQTERHRQHTEVMRQHTEILKQETEMLRQGVLVGKAPKAAGLTKAGFTVGIACILFWEFWPITVTGLGLNLYALVEYRGKPHQWMAWVGLVLSICYLLVAIYRINPDLWLFEFIEKKLIV